MATTRARWTKDEKEIVLRGMENNESPSEIALRLQDSKYDRSATAVEKKIRDLKKVERDKKHAASIREDLHTLGKRSRPRNSAIASPKREPKGILISRMIIRSFLILCSIFDGPFKSQRAQSYHQSRIEHARSGKSRNHDR